MNKKQRRLFEIEWNEKVELVKKFVKDGMPINEAKRISGLDQLLRVS
jgi:hypothetical protein